MQNTFLWEKEMKEIVPYIPGEQPKGSDIIKLNTNENPYPPAPKIKEVLASFNTEVLRKYPDPSMVDLRNVIASYHGVDTDNVFVGVGSDDVLATAFLTFFTNRKKPILFPDITYSFYDVWADLFSIYYECQPLKDDFSIDFKDYLRENGGIVIANPNAPTGISMERESLINIIKRNPESVVIVDEAYVDFGGESMLPFVGDYDNLLVVRTFSKSRALAGSRIGYAIGNKRLIYHLFAVRNSFNSYTMDTITMAIAIESIRDEGYFKEQVTKIIATREKSKEKLSSLGFTFGDSKANFIFAKHNSMPAKLIFEELRKRKIYVRYFDKIRIDNYLRISIGTDKEMDIFFNTLGEILK